MTLRYVIALRYVALRYDALVAMFLFAVNQLLLF